MFVIVNNRIMSTAAYNLIMWRRSTPPAVRYVPAALAAHYGYVDINARGELVSVAPEQAQAV